jgi:hypothetical protein
MSRAGSTPFRTPGEALKGLHLSPGQRDLLVEGMCKLRDQEDHLDRISKTLPSHKEYQRKLTVARSAVATLIRVFNTPLGADLLSMEIRDTPKSSHHPDGRPVQRFPVKRFLDLLPVIKARLDAATRPVALIALRRDKAFTLAYCALDLANEVGCVRGAFKPTSEIEDPPSGEALEVVARILSFVERKWLDIDTVRKRFPPKKQIERVGQTLPATFRRE